MLLAGKFLVMFESNRTVGLGLVFLLAAATAFVLPLVERRHNALDAGALSIESADDLVPASFADAGAPEAMHRCGSSIDYESTLRDVEEGLRLSEEERAKKAIKLFERGRNLFQELEYESALKEFEGAVLLAPDEAIYRKWLDKTQKEQTEHVPGFDRRSAEEVAQSVLDDRRREWDRGEWSVETHDVRDLLRDRLPGHAGSHVGQNTGGRAAVLKSRIEGLRSPWSEVSERVMLSDSGFLETAGDERFQRSVRDELASLRELPSEQAPDCEEELRVLNKLRTTKIDLSFADDPLIEAIDFISEFAKIRIAWSPGALTRAEHTRLDLQHRDAVLGPTVTEILDRFGLRADVCCDALVIHETATPLPVFTIRDYDFEVTALPAADSEAERRETMQEALHISDPLRFTVQERQIRLRALLSWEEHGHLRMRIKALQAR